ncbi:MAG: hypothetical protein Q4E91_09690 [Lachnospiraceae bacterium]|nr:hypothetical protein [Lachnospiraceae bacterium]
MKKEVGAVVKSHLQSSVSDVCEHFLWIQILLLFDFAIAPYKKKGYSGRIAGENKRNDIVGNKIICYSRDEREQRHFDFAAPHFEKEGTQNRFYKEAMG